MQQIENMVRGIVPESININKTDFYSCNLISEIEQIVESSNIKSQSS